MQKFREVAERLDRDLAIPNMLPVGSCPTAISILEAALIEAFNDGITVIAFKCAEMLVRHGHPTASRILVGYRDAYSLKLPAGG